MAATNKTKTSKSIIIALLLVFISFALSIFLFATVLDKLLLWQSEGAFLNVALRILLTLFIVLILWGTLKKTLLKPVALITGLFYCVMLLYVIMVKVPGRSGVNLNPFAIINDFMTIPFYPISNFLFFVPAGFFLRYVFVRNVPKFLYLAGFIVSIILELIQLIFDLGIFDVTDIILNGGGFAVGVWLFALLYRNPKARVFFHT